MLSVFAVSLHLPYIICPAYIFGLLKSLCVRCVSYSAQSWILQSPYFWLVHYTLPGMWLEFHKIGFFFLFFFYSTRVKTQLNPSSFGVFFFFSVLMRYNGQNCKIFKVHIMVIWYTGTLWKVNLLSAVLYLFGPKSPPGPSGLAGFSFSVLPYWFSHPSRTGFPLPPRRPYIHLSMVNLKSTDIKV